MAICSVEQFQITVAAPAVVRTNSLGADATIAVTRLDGSALADLGTSLSFGVPPIEPGAGVVPLASLPGDAVPVANLPPSWQTLGTVGATDSPALVTVVHRYSVPVAEDL